MAQQERQSYNSTSLDIFSEATGQEDGYRSVEERYAVLFDQAPPSLIQKLDDLEIPGLSEALRTINYGDESNSYDMVLRRIALQARAVACGMSYLSPEEQEVSFVYGNDLAFPEVQEKIIPKGAIKKGHYAIAHINWRYNAKRMNDLPLVLDAAKTMETNGLTAENAMFVGWLNEETARNRRPIDQLIERMPNYLSGRTSGLRERMLHAGYAVLKQLHLLYDNPPVGTGAAEDRYDAIKKYFELTTIEENVKEVSANLGIPYSVLVLDCQFLNQWDQVFAAHYKRKHTFGRRPHELSPGTVYFLNLAEPLVREFEERGKGVTLEDLLAKFPTIDPDLLTTYYYNFIHHWQKGPDVPHGVRNFRQNPLSPTYEFHQIALLPEQATDVGNSSRPILIAGIGGLEEVLPYGQSFFARETNRLSQEDSAEFSQEGFPLLTELSTVDVPGLSEAICRIQFPGEIGITEKDQLEIIGQNARIIAFGMPGLSPMEQRIAFLWTQEEIPTALVEALVPVNVDMATRFVEAYERLETSGRLGQIPEVLSLGADLERQGRTVEQVEFLSWLKTRLYQKIGTESVNLSEIANEIPSYLCNNPQERLDLLQRGMQTLCKLYPDLQIGNLYLPASQSESAHAVEPSNETEKTNNTPTTSKKHTKPSSGDNAATVIFEIAQDYVPPVRNDETIISELKRTTTRVREDWKDTVRARIAGYPSPAAYDPGEYWEVKESKTS